MNVKQGRWSDEELTILGKYYPNNGPDFCAKLLNRKAESVRYKAKDLQIRTKLNKQKTHEQYVNELTENNIVFKPLERYNTSYTPILHCCPEGHRWYVRPNTILAGHGCPGCSKHGFSKLKPAVFYCISLTHKEKIYYKIGITNKSVKERFKIEWEKFNIKILIEEIFEDGALAFEKEQKIIKANSTNIVKKGILPLGGNREIFTVMPEIS